jgi:hypothetical protein
MEGGHISFGLCRDALQCSCCDSARTSHKPTIRLGPNPILTLTGIRACRATTAAHALSPIPGHAGFTETAHSATYFAGTFGLSPFESRAFLSITPGQKAAPPAEHLRSNRGRVGRWQLGYCGRSSASQHERNHCRRGKRMSPCWLDGAPRTPHEQILDVLRPEGSRSTFGEWNLSIRPSRHTAARHEISIPKISAWVIVRQAVPGDALLCGGAVSMVATAVLCLRVLGDANTELKMEQEYRRDDEQRFA